MIKTILSIDHNTYSLEYNEDGLRYTGNVYPVSVYDFDGSDCVLYISERDGTDILTPNDKDKPRVFFEFSFCYRGVWEGRIYFKDSEYWSEELIEMAKLWDEIQITLKEKMKIQNPVQHFED